MAQSRDDDILMKGLLTPDDVFQQLADNMLALSRVRLPCIVPTALTRSARAQLRNTQGITSTAELAPLAGVIQDLHALGLAHDERVKVRCLQMKRGP